MKSLREYIELLKKEGEILTIEQEVSWRLEAPAIQAMSQRVGGPACFFPDIKGHPKGYSLLGGCFAGTPKQPWRRLAIALGMNPDVHFHDVVKEFIKRTDHPMKPTIVSTGPVKQNIVMGDEVDIFKFPWPYLHEGDGGRYGTMSAIIQKDPDSDWVNWANYRMAVLTPNRLGAHFTPGQQGADLYFQKYEARNQVMPSNIVIGGSPAVFLAASYYLPPGVSEGDVAGGLQMEPLEVVKAETNDLYVPAHAEVVFECEVYPYERWDAGPFGEYMGFMHGPRYPEPVFRVKCITFRDNPILPFCVEGIKVSDSHSIGATTFPVGLYYLLTKRMGWPVKLVTVSTVVPWGFLVVSTEVPYSGYVQQLANFLLSVGFMVYADHVIIVDADIDPTDVDSILEEMMVNMNLEKDFYIYDRAPKGSETVYFTDEEKLRQELTGKLIYDATRKERKGVDFSKRSRLENFYSKGTQEWVFKKWKELGFEEEPELKIPPWKSL